MSSGCARPAVSRARETQADTVEMEALRRRVVELFGRSVELSPGVPDELASMAAVLGGSFDWLLDPREDVYTLEDGEPL